MSERLRFQVTSEPRPDIFFATLTGVMGFGYWTLARLTETGSAKAVFLPMVVCAGVVVGALWHRGLKRPATTSDDRRSGSRSRSRSGAPLFFITAASGLGLLVGQVLGASGMVWASLGVAGLMAAAATDAVLTRRSSRGRASS
jgi:hypothetical protein